MLEEAAVELFLEQGYPNTSVADITRRAGVSRATFFNYVPTKSDLLWTGVDDWLESLRERLADSSVSSETGSIQTEWLRLAADLAPGSVVLAFANAETMGVADELEEAAARRQRAAAQIVAEALRRRGHDRLDAEVIGAAHAGAFLAALAEWARLGPGTARLPDILKRAFAALAVGSC